jgi:pyrroloquinoline quinone biosynthesis protein E
VKSPHHIDLQARAAAHAAAEEAPLVYRSAPGKPLTEPAE